MTTGEILAALGGARVLVVAHSGYYFRPQKTILVRTVADGGESFYFCGEHRATLPALWRILAEEGLGSGQ